MKKVVLYDMNYFYAQVEERDNPTLKEFPIAVGAEPEERGSIITTCNYKAREYGVRSGMPSAKGRELCPKLRFIKARGRVYSAIHQEIKEIVLEYSDSVEFISLDEGYIDVTHTEWLFGGADNIALEIQKRIFEVTKLTCSVGVGYNKMTAKLAAEQIKPNGFFNMDTREKFLETMSDKNVREIPGIGEKISLRLNMLGVYTIEDLQNFDPFELKKAFKTVMSKWLQAVAEGYDSRTIYSFSRGEKSIGRSVTLMKNTRDIRILKNTLIDISKVLSFKLKKRELYATTISLKLRWESHDHKLKTRQLHMGINRSDEIFEISLELLKLTKLNKLVRGLGISVGGLVPHRYTQLKLGEKCKDDKLKKVEDLTFKLRKKYGYDIVYDGKVEIEKERDNDGKIMKDLYLRI